MNKKSTILGLSQIELHCQNIETSLHFYQHCLGLDLTYDARPTLAIMATQNMQLVLSCEVDNLTVKNNSSPILYFAVDDIFSLYQQLSNEAIQFEQSPKLTNKVLDISVWQAFLRDPDGHLIGLQCHI